VTAAGAATPETDVALEARLREIAARSGGSLGVSALLLAGGRRAAVAGGDRFPMASSYKLPIAIAVLGRVDDGTLTLAQRVPIRRSDLRPGPPGLAQRWRPGQKLTVGALLSAMIAASDNTACDVLLELVGGPSAVGARLHALGIGEIDVSRPESGLMFDSFGVTAPPPRAQWTLERIQKLTRDVPAASKRAAIERFMNDPRDTATPDAVVALLERFTKGELLRPGTTRYLRDMLYSTATGPGRLKGQLPKEAAVAHKTGTCVDRDGFNCTNDVGLIDLPGGRQAAVAVYLKNAAVPDADREKTIADVGRAVYDAWASASGERGR
jgi:beta-lactamase class A